PSIFTSLHGAFGDANPLVLWRNRGASVHPQRDSHREEMTRRGPGSWCLGTRAGRAPPQLASVSSDRSAQDRLWQNLPDKAAESPEHLGGTDPGHRLNTGTAVARPSEGTDAPPEKSPAPVDSGRRFPDM